MSLYLMLMVPDICNAYFQAKGEEQGFLQAGYKVHQGTNENVFALFDDINSTNTKNKQILFPRSKFFISVDSISIAFPMSIVFYNHITTENALADLLYANLKFKKLVDEYEEVQKRSKRLTWDSQYLFQQNENTDSIYQEIKKLKESSIQTNIERSIFASNRPRDISFRPLFSNNTQFKSNYILPVIKTNERVSNEVGSELSGQNRNKSYKGGSDSFIVKVFISLAAIIPYFLTHKGEALFYGLGLTLMLLFFSAIFRK